MDIDPLGTALTSLESIGGIHNAIQRPIEYCKAYSILFWK